MREPRFLGRVLVAVASIVAAALLAAPALSAIGSTQEQQTPGTSQVEDAAATEPDVVPQSSTTPSSSPASSPTAGPSPSQSQTTDPQAPHSAAGAVVEKSVRDVLDKVGQLVEQVPPGPMDECLIDIGGIGPVNICI